MNNKAPVVIVHGMWTTPDILNTLRETFQARGHAVYTPRLPLHYPLKEMSEQARQELANTSIRAYADSIVRFIKGLPRKPILLGHSMGGLVAQLAAASTECEKLIILSSAPPAGINGWSLSMIRTFGHNLLKFPMWKLTTDMRIKNVRYGIANTQSLQKQMEIYDNSTLESGRVTWEIGMWFLYRHPPTKIDYSAIQCPVLIMGGSEDKITPIGIQRKLAEKYGDKAEFLELTGACHWLLNGRHYDRVIENIDRWLENDSQILDVA